MSSEHRSKSSHFTRGGQITFHSLHMFFQVNNALFKWIGYGVLILTVVLTGFTTTTNTFRAVGYYWKYFFMAQTNTSLDREVISIWEGQRFVSTLEQQLQNPILRELNDQFWYQLQVNFLIASLSGFAVFGLIMAYFKKQGTKQSDDHHIRGIQKAAPGQIEKVLKKKGRVSDFAIDGHRLFKADFEVQHLLWDGTTGAGKSVGMRKLVSWLRARGDKAIIYDKGCTFVSKFYDPDQDVILNPFDERCANWNVWCDAKEAPDYENMAAALIPQHGDGDPFWVDSARTIFSTTAFQMSKDNKECTTQRLLHLMLTSELETLGQYLKGTESASLVSDKIEKTAISIKSVLATYIKSLRFLDGLDAKHSDGSYQRPPFSIKNWVQDDNQKGFLFLSSNAHQHTSLRPLISMWLAIASNSILGLEPDPNRRIWVIMDEMPSLHKLPELGSIIAEVRKFGGCYVIGIQSYAQLVKTYGKNAADEMFDLLNTRFYFRAPSAEMAKISSADLGEQEVDISKENVSYGANTLRDGVSLGHQTITRPVVSASEIQVLDDLSCWVRVPNCNLVTNLDLKFDKMKDLCAPFIKRDHAMSEVMENIYQELVYHEVMAPNLLSKQDRDTLLNEQSQTFENDKERDAEVNAMKTAATKRREQARAKSREQKKRRETEQFLREQDEQLTVDESAIAQTMDMSEFAD